jgi:Zn-dependent M28 family amino/carboxypeptidase
VHVIEQTITSDNVVGLLRGSDPALRDEYVVLTAHLDHVGVGRPVEGDSIYNGAMDNAAGSALLMEMARVLASQRGNLRRSVLLVAVTGEEKGLLGSRYFAFHPTVANGSIVANLNTDMFLPIIPLKMIMANGLEESDLAENATATGRAVGVPVVTDPEPEENRFVRSDQYSFILRGIPALSVKVGFGRDTPEHQRIKEFRARRYHRPADDPGQPVDLDAAAGFARFYAALVKEVANRDHRPEWNTESYFRGLTQPGPRLPK